MKQIIIIIVLVAFGTGAWWLIEPLLGDDVVNEEIAITIPARTDPDRQDNFEAEIDNYLDSLSDNQAVPQDNILENPTVLSRDNPTTISVSNTTNPALQIAEQPTDSSPQNTVEPTAPQILQGSFRDADPSHRASGQVYVSGNTISLADLKSTNVPDGFIHLSNDLQARDSIQIAKLKGNVGNQNYTIPEGIDASDYKYVLIWCRAFSVLVGSAEIK